MFGLKFNGLVNTIKFIQPCVILPKHTFPGQA